MNKVITINLGGTAYQLEEGGYEALHEYLETATERLRGNPDREEILSDIECAIGDKLRALLSNYKNVVTEKEVDAVLAEMGAIEVDADPGATAGAGAGGSGAANKTGGAGAGGERQSAGPGGFPRRLYRIREGATIAGVCNGLGVYLGVDPSFVRLGFVLLMVVWGTGLLAYIIMAIVIPEARTPEEKAAASGYPATSQEFIRRAQEGYYEAMKNFPDRAAWRAWKRRFKRDMRAHTNQWRCNWHGYWAQRAPVHPGMAFTLPLLSFLQGALTVVWLCAIVSLLATGSILGMDLPDNVPVWLAAILLMIAYGILEAPLKAARRMCYWSLGQPKWGWSILFLADAIVWVAILVVLFCLAVHFFPEVREAIQGFPAYLHEAVHDISRWWHGK